MRGEEQRLLAEKNPYVAEGKERKGKERRGAAGEAAADLQPAGAEEYTNFR